MNSTVKKRIFVLAGAAVILVLWILWGNTALQTRTWRIADEEIPAPFSGFRIAQVSDLHNAVFGQGNETLLSHLRKAEPDIIVVTGDLVDSRRTDIQIAVDFCGAAMEIAPVYYVTGNHEARLRSYPQLKSQLLDKGVVILENGKVQLYREGAFITLLGIHDPSFRTDYLFGDSKTVTAEALAQLRDEEDGYRILLAHRPELMDTYAQADIDLVFSGHAHGGQFRLPFIGGLYAPNQGFFPKYDGGLYRKDDTAMLVSRGVGNSIIPIRFANRPEIVVVQLTAAE